MNNISDEARKCAEELWPKSLEFRLFEPIIQRHMTAYAIAYHESQAKELVKDKERLDKLLRPINWIGVAEVRSVKGSATWHMSRESIDEFYATNPDAIRTAEQDAARKERDDPTDDPDRMGRL